MADMPAPIHEYIEEVCDQLRTLTEWPESVLPTAEKISFFRWVRGGAGAAGKAGAAGAAGAGGAGYC
jgi:hypothetical protein